MEQITFEIENSLYEAYKELGADAGRTAEQVMGEVLTQFVSEAPFKK